MRPKYLLMSCVFLLSAATADAYTVFVSNEKDNTVSVLDSTTLEVVKTVKVGQRPRGSPWRRMARGC